MGVSDIRGILTIGNPTIFGSVLGVPCFRKPPDVGAEFFGPV